MCTHNICFHRKIYKKNVSIFFLFLCKNMLWVLIKIALLSCYICFKYSLEVPPWSASDEYQQGNNIYFMEKLEK